ncbi:MAG: Holliday junction resolvase-like protein [Candidatus Gracilibacteria bacterium]|nr:Holliday junction resolvase-like protein [Candidatus Gracilibacteria bacterium]
MQKSLLEAPTSMILSTDTFTIGLSEVWLIVGAIVLSLFIGFVWGRLVRHRAVIRERNDAVGRSRSVILGELYETIAPLIPGFRYAPRDMVFIGKGVDYLVFDGLSEGHLKEIVFLELKTGKSKQNANEKMIENCIRQGRVKYELDRKNSSSG